MNSCTYAISHIGLVRKRNEDSYCVCRPASGSGALLAVICDGIGGHAGGDMASLSCCRSLAAAWLRSGGGAENVCDAASAVEFLRREIAMANEHLHQRNLRENNPLPMGCTVVAAVLTGNIWTVANAGDSRFYQYDKDTMILTQKSCDDVPGMPEMAELGMQKKPCHVITGAVGLRHEIKIHIGHLEFRRAKRFLLCSDGLYNEVDELGIGQILKKSENAKQCASELVRRALINGGRDNITVITVFPEEMQAK